MSAQLIQSLLPHLPRFAEEEGDFYSVPRVALIDALCQSQTLERAIAKNTVALLEILLDTLAVLDTAALQNGEWRFVSFPAQLLATSVLTAMSDGDSRLFAGNFWNTQASDNEQKDRQRDVLRIIEQARQDHHTRRQAQPIRYCYVAWSIIKLDGNILFYQREDTQKRFDKAAGDYGLLGGRCNQTDVVGMSDKSALLQALQSANSQRIKNALPQTLRRELQEEAGLLFEEHYRFKLWRNLKPYRQVQGAAPNHALTEYYLAIFQIELTLEGYLFLQERIKKDIRLAWFSLSDIEMGKSADGKLPYIKALYDEFAGDRTALATELRALPDSFAAGYLSDKSKYALTLPVTPLQPLFAGALGKEKPLNLKVSPDQLALILGLAAHLRGFRFTSLDQSLVLHPYGWVETSERSTIRQSLIDLAAFLSGSELIMENHQDRFFRLSIKPESRFFAEALFTFNVSAHDMLSSTLSKIPAFITRDSIVTALGMVETASADFKLPIGLVHNLKKLADHVYAADNDDAVKIEDAYEKSLHQDADFKALGLRKLIRREDGRFKFVLAFHKL